MKKVLIFGGSGLVGSAIKRRMCDKYDVFTTYCHKKKDNKDVKFDVEEIESVDAIMNTIKPDIVISCLRGDFEKQFSVHKRIARYVQKNDVMMYYFSTANVYDDDYTKSHTESDKTRSCTDYGKFKIECENELSEMLKDKVCIIRIPQVWGKHCPRLDNLIELNNKKEKLVLYPHLQMSTNTDDNIAAQLDYIIQKNLKGTFNLTAQGTIGYDVLYKKIMNNFGLNDIVIEENDDEKGCFALSSERFNEFPESLKLSNEDVINYICNVRI